MRRLPWVLIIALAFSTVATAADIAFYIGQWNTDGWYSEQQFTDVETIIAQTGHLFRDVQQFDDDQFEAFGAWVDENTDDGELDIIWLNGCLPSVLYPYPNLEVDGSRIEEWLDGGNMVINVGDWFAYVSYETGSREPTNGEAGAANILDLSSGIIQNAGGTQVTVTGEGEEYLPSLGSGIITTDRPVALGAVDAPWEVAAEFASNGTQADPVVIRNTETGGYLAIINQASGGPGGWIDDRGLTCAEFIGNWVNSVVGLADPALASDPMPEDEAVDVLRDVVLGWAPGDHAVTHDVYFGTVFDDVNTASRDDPMGVLVSQDQSETTYDPDGLLDFGVTYYWRIDEVNGAPDNTIFKGETWSFTAEPMGYPIESVIASTTGIPMAGAVLENTVNGAGLNELDQHSITSSDMWVGVADGDIPLQFQYEFDRVYKMHEMLVWNYNVQFELILGFGLKDVTVEYSLDGAEWMTLGDVVVAQGTASSDYAANTAVAFDGVAAKYVRITVNTGHGMMGQFGLSEVRFLYIPAHAREPEPADGATNVSVNPALAWRAGRDSISHDVYVGTDPDALVLDGTVDVASYALDALDLDTLVYWRVDENQEVESWEGNLWSFTTQAYLVVDDFESYTDDEGSRIYQTWVDGYGVPANGSTVGHLQSPFAEQTIVKSGKQSMPLFYDNAGTSMSEAELTLSADWSASSIQGLTLSFHGDADNTGGQLYVKINGTKISYDGPASNLTQAGWNLWTIDLATVGNVSNVTSLIIGIEGAGANGEVYIDDVRLYPKILAYYTLPDITGPDDTVQGVPNDGDWPDGEHPGLAVDNDVNTKYLHRKGGAMSTGIQVTPAAGSTVVTGLTLTTANDVPTRDPITFELSGSNAGIDGPYTLIAAGDIVDFAGETDWPRFTKNETLITFDNDVAYAHYQIVFPTLRGESQTLMQIAEIELIGE